MELSKKQVYYVMFESVYIVLSVKSVVKFFHSLGLRKEVWQMQFEIDLHVLILWLAGSNISDMYSGGIVVKNFKMFANTHWSNHSLVSSQLI